jgi:multidrug transporter EmrE-like cation transporter
MTHSADEQPSNRDPRAGVLLGLCIGVAIGVSLGVALDNIPIGVAIGLGVGASLAAAFSGRKQEPSKPMILAGVVLLLVGIILLAVIMSLALPHWWCDYPVLNLLPGC